MTLKKERANYVDESLKKLNEIKDSYNFTTEETYYLEDYDIKLTIKNIEDVRDACERSILVLENYLKIKQERKKENKMKLKKELVDDVIRSYKNCYRTSDVDIIPAVSKDELELKGKATWSVAHLIGDLARFSQRSGKGTYQDIYKVLAIFGIIVE